MINFYCNPGDLAKEFRKYKKRQLMRLSCVKGDPHCNHKLSCVVEVYLDGKPIDGVYMADEEHGYIERHKKVDGRFCLNSTRTGPIKETLFGNVKIFLKENPLPNK